MNNINCSKCGGDHWGTPIGWCPFHDEPLPDTTGWPKPGHDIDRLVSEARFSAKKMRDDSADGQTVRVPINVARILEDCVRLLTTPRAEAGESVGMEERKIAENEAKRIVSDFERLHIQIDLVARGWLVEQFQRALLRTAGDGWNRDMSKAPRDESKPECKCDAEKSVDPICAANGECSRD